MQVFCEFSDFFGVLKWFLAAKKKTGNCEENRSFRVWSYFGKIFVFTF